MTEKQMTYHIVFPEDPRVQTLKLDETNRLAPLKLKTRVDIYRKFKRENPNCLVTSTLYPLAWSEYHQLVGGDENWAKSHYVKMQPPIIGVDCDYVALAPDTKDIKELLQQEIKQSIETGSNFNQHQNPKHLETISEHTQMVSKAMLRNSHKENENAPETKAEHLKAYDNAVYYNSGYYHDLGKYWTKIYHQDLGCARFFGHENVSAVIFFTSALQGKTNLDLLGNGFNQAVADVTQAILNHMSIKNGGFTGRYIKRRGLTPYQIKLIKTLSEIDNLSRKEETQYD